jgi:hypothetical protein
MSPGYSGRRINSRRRSRAPSTRRSGAPACASGRYRSTGASEINSEVTHHAHALPFRLSCAYHLSLGFSLGFLERKTVKTAFSLVICAAFFAMLQGNASADERSLSDQCRAKVRAGIKGPACQKPQADRQGDPCTIGGLETMKVDFYARTALCVDRRKSRPHFARWLADMGV